MGRKKKTCVMWDRGEDIANREMEMVKDMQQMFHKRGQHLESNFIAVRGPEEQPVIRGQRTRKHGERIRGQIGRRMS